jgi:hypothetical protein
VRNWPAPLPRPSGSQAYHTKFRYDVFHVPARVRGHMHVRYDARNRAILRGRFQSDEKDFPPMENEAPLTKSNCPPEPLYGWPSMNSPLPWPYRSISTAVFTLIRLSCCAITWRSLA